MTELPSASQERDCSVEYISMFRQLIYFLAKCFDCMSSGNVFSQVEQPDGIKKPRTVAVFCGHQHVC